MPKLKTNKSARKRFKKTGTGKFLRNQAGKRHILTKKTTKRKRKMRGSGVVAQSDSGRARRMLQS